MLDYIKQHKILFISILGIITLAVFGLMIYLNQKTKTSEVPELSKSESGYEFLKGELTKEAEYLMLQAKISVEEFGTYSKTEFVGLLDLQNQSTENFQKKVQSIINSLPNSEKNISTEIDPNSIELSQISPSEYEVSLTGKTTDLNTNKTTSVSAKITLIKKDLYWLVDNIEFNNR